MTLSKVETIKNQAELLGVIVVPIDHKNGIYSVVVGSYSYYGFNKALSALTTVYLKRVK